MQALKQQKMMTGMIMLPLFPRALPIGKTPLSASESITPANFTRKLLKRWSHRLPQKDILVKPYIQPELPKYTSHESQAGTRILGKQLPQPLPVPL